MIEFTIEEQQLLLTTLEQSSFPATNMREWVRIIDKLRATMPAPREEVEAIPETKEEVK